MVAVEILPMLEEENARIKAQKISASRKGEMVQFFAPSQKSRDQAAAIVGANRQYISDANQITKQRPDLADRVKTGEITIPEAKAIVRKEERTADIERQTIEIAESTPQAPAGLFHVISIDPPWPYGTEYDAIGRRAANPYPEMSLEQIKGLTIPAADDCVLWLWTTHKFMRHSFDLLDAWGFRDVAILTWHKDRMGLGSWLRSQSEFCIMAVKGSPLVNLTNQTTVLHGPLREHSRKPDEFYAMVDQLCTGRKLDFFSRNSRTGWEQFGNDLERFTHAG
jgi:N6-adenosine-specific RNA methylase IME4